MLFCFWNCYFLEITSQTWRQKIINKKLLVISCIHLEEQTKDILKLKSVSNTTIRDVAKHLTFGGRMLEDYTYKIIIKLFVIDWHSHTKFWEKRGVWGSPPENFYIFEVLGLNFRRFLKQIRKQIS
jgi:hypothetical protein